MSEPAVACILVNWNNWQDTAACLDALAAQDTPGLTVLVVDNASTNDSVAQLRTRHPWVTLLESPENVGFPKACNLGARHLLALQADFLWFLNNDTVAPPDTLTHLLAKARTTPEAGIIGAVLRYFDAPHTVQAWGGGTVSRWTGYSRHFTAPEPLGPNSYLTFASVLVRRPLFDQLGGLYEGAFMYFEDADFCFRARAAGAQLAVAEATAILHKEGGSQNNVRPQLDRIFSTAGLLFMRRHAPVAWIGEILFLGSRVAKRIATLRFGALKPIFLGAADSLRQRP